MFAALSGAFLALVAHVAGDSIGCVDRLLRAGGGTGPPPPGRRVRVCWFQLLAEAEVTAGRPDRAPPGRPGHNKRRRDAAPAQAGLRRTGHGMGLEHHGTGRRGRHRRARRPHVRRVDRPGAPGPGAAAGRPVPARPRATPRWPNACWPTRNGSSPVAAPRVFADQGRPRPPPPRPAHRAGRGALDAGRTDRAGARRGHAGRRGPFEPRGGQRPVSVGPHRRGAPDQGVRQARVSSRSALASQVSRCPL